ncbi:lisH domain-containing protein ARMC9 isoform X2 [Andrena cerasifolii]|uniref:lisH domain-containing protein ARMC9 isoform X2 n=1 Tax=Andrena cerasifolii TaxID=2819439 RepID=UPI004037668F
MRIHFFYFTCYVNSFTIEVEKNMNDSMEQLREFLNTTGKELENDPELRPFFALPFMEDPYAEPFLSKVFERSWIDKLTESLHMFLEKYKEEVSCNMKQSDAESNKISVNQGSLSEDSKSDSTAKKKARNDNVPIIPNERNVPMLLEDDEDGEHLSLYDDAKYSQRSINIQTTLPNPTEETDSLHLARSSKRLAQYTQELAATKSHLYSVHSNYEKLKVRFHKLHADYHKLMSIARVLTTALENSVKGQAVDFQTMLETCIKIFPDLFNQNIRDSSHISNSISELQLDKFHCDMKVVKPSAPYVTSVPPKLLDFKKIKLHFINGSIKMKLFLLQALRRKVTFGQPGERDEAVHEYISRDLLGLHGQIASYKGKSILPYLLTPENIVMPHPLQQSTARLLNALASFRCGRDYLSFDSTVVDMVYKCLNCTADNDVDTFTCNMMIAMLQKLSLRKQQRIYMIENGLVEWLIRHLHDQSRIMDSYRLEYATALLMNLSLHQIAQRRASTMATLLISTLITLLLMDHASALPYVNGALNNFLTNPAINEEAKKMKFACIVEQYSKHKSGEMRKHMDHILQIHRGEITIKTETEETADNDDEEFDVLEHQLEENDPVKNSYGELCGESLLESCYTILPKASREKEMILDHESSSKQFKMDMMEAAVYDNQEQAKDSRHESVSHLKIIPRLENKSRAVKDKNNTKAQQDSMKEINSNFHSKTSKNHYENVVPNAQTKLQQLNINSLNNRSKYKRSEVYNESAVYLYENQPSNNSSKTTVTSSMILGLGSEAESTLMEKLSSIASLDIDNKATSDNTASPQEAELDLEEAFLARPKLPRTPP